jgi:hypothetical protein
MGAKANCFVLRPTVAIALATAVFGVHQRCTNNLRAARHRQLLPLSRHAVLFVAPPTVVAFFSTCCCLVCRAADSCSSASYDSIKCFWAVVRIAALVEASLRSESD